jgi:hypothetical protein
LKELDLLRHRRGRDLRLAMTPRRGSEAGVWITLDHHSGFEHVVEMRTVCR